MKFIRDRIARDKKNARKHGDAVRASSKPARASKPAPVLHYAPPRKPVSKPSPKPAHNNAPVRTREDTQPVIRLRTLLIGLGVLVGCMVGPLALVWKQSYINQVSIKLESRAETLKTLNGEITSLKLEQTRLSAAPRIERVARSRGLEYPSSERLIILDGGPAGQWNDDRFGGFIARVKSFILGERG